MKSRTIVWLLGSGIILFCAALVLDLLPPLRGDLPSVFGKTGWVWPYDHPRWLWLIPAAAGVALYCAGVLYLLKKPHNPRRLILWVFVGAALLPLLLLTLEGRPLFLLFTRAASPLTGGYQYATTLVDDLGDTLRHWPQFTADYLERTTYDPSGVALDPPGLVALYYGDKTLFEAVPPLANNLGTVVRPLQCQNLAMMTWDNAEMASSWIQLFMPLWAALAVAPLYRLGTMLFNRASARFAVVLWPLVPGMAIFTPRFNVFYPLITLVMLLMLWRGLESNRVRWIGVSGFIISVGTFFNLSLLPLGLLAGLMILGHRFLHRRSGVRRATIDLLVFGAACASVWVIYGLLTGISPLEIIRIAMERHTRLDRPYVPWMFMHVYDMFLFVGLPVAFFALWRIGQVRRVLQPGDLLAGAAGLTLLILVVSGTARGETGRVWLFFAPVWVLLAANRLAALERKQAVVMLAVQAICLLSMAAVIRANFTTLTEPVDLARAAEPPMFPVNMSFSSGEDRLTLLGLNIEKTPTEIILYLHWKAEVREQKPYVLSMIPVLPDGSTGQSLNWNPADWNYPPSCWKPGEEFVDPVHIALGDPIISGDWAFSLSILDAFTQERMSVTKPDGGIDQQIGIGPVRIESASAQN